MCDPLVGGLIAGAASIASAGIQSSMNADLASKQQAANDQWVAYQMKIHQQQAAAEDQARNAANQAREATLEKVSPQNQQQEQVSEQQRLNSLYNDPTTSAEKAAGTDPNAPPPPSQATRVSSTSMVSGASTGMEFSSGAGGI